MATMKRSQSLRAPALAPRNQVAMIGVLIISKFKIATTAASEERQLRAPLSRMQNRNQKSQILESTNLHRFHERQPRQLLRREDPEIRRNRQPILPKAEMVIGSKS